MVLGSKGGGVVVLGNKGVWKWYVVIRGWGSGMGPSCLGLRTLNGVGPVSL